ncbi:MAG: aminomethyl-transferring glycine dehydrogenase [Xanthobacteraceae bacterium]
MNAQFDTAEFSQKHIGPSASDVADMLKIVSAASLDALMDETVPEAIRERGSLDIGESLSEVEVLAQLRQIGAKNKLYTSLIGQGYHATILPAVIQRNILENPAWYTAYTPYQAEISQGRLEALLNFQTMICDLTGLDVANASLLDEATAAAEAMAMAHRVTRSKAREFFVDAHCHPQVIGVLETRAEALGWRLVVGDPFGPIKTQELFGAILQYPGTFGDIRDSRPVISRLQQAGVIVTMAADPLALTLLVSPGELGADIAVGSTQRFGLPLGYGGPHAAYIATKDAFKRSLPGRVVGVSIDARGATVYRLALQTREQHIRREKATSNICTAQVLPAVIASMYAVYHGPEGVTAIARRIHAMTALLAGALRRLGLVIDQEYFFDTVAVRVGERQDEILRRANDLRINLRKNGEGAAARIIVTLDETTTLSIVEIVCRAFGGDLSPIDAAQSKSLALPEALIRKSHFLQHPVFRLHHSETEMLRYMRRLSDRDLALDRAMIPLGSCTMKLNATTEMMPLSWPEFSSLHPFVPADQACGYAEMIEGLAEKLCAITGFKAISFQPNSGAQGEYAGLLAIRAYHRSRGEEQRNICLIPSSAHGTNPASAQMAGMEVVVVGCSENGNVDIVQLRAAAERHAARLAAIMITYPSTHGVFEAGIREICEIVHARGGQVYLDGANFNAQIGLARPAEYGADVCHLNLHKTFCIPHGGGGPGMGPIAVQSHLAPFLPGRGDSDASLQGAGPVSATAFGSASILAISWTYIRLMGEAGLGKATKVAILNANYLACRLKEHYPILYTGPNGRVAHEFILDTREFQDSCGVTVEDIAKRLIDYGFHAPTMSFPVSGTLMIEPTESESKVELDRFCDAMISIRQEIRDVELGKYSAADSPLRHAPHTVHDLAVDTWMHPYSRATACFASTLLRSDKYWAPVNRVDNVYGDRNLICSCPPIEAYQSAAE